jgi:hypothetical protein
VSDTDVEPQIDVASSSPTPNPPIRERNVPYDDRDVVTRYAERFEALDDLSIEGPLCVCRAPGEGVDAHLGVAIGLSCTWRARKSVRLVSEKPDMPVVRWYPECSAQRSVNCVHQSHLLRFRVLPACLDQNVWHFASLSSETCVGTWTRAPCSRHRLSAGAGSIHAAPNHMASATRAPASEPSPTHATYPSGRINTALGAVTTPSTGSSHSAS